MKASVKLREEKQPPLVRAKIPINFLGLPFMSGISVGTSKELGLHVSTLLETGPSFKLTYRPNDSQGPLGLTLKTGFGIWGSPRGAALIMAAEFNLFNKGKSPAFFLHVKPRFGDFGLRKDATSYGIPCMENVAKIGGRSMGGEDCVVYNDGGLQPVEGLRDLHSKVPSPVLCSKVESREETMKLSMMQQVGLEELLAADNSKEKQALLATRNDELAGALNDRMSVASSDEGCLLVSMPDGSPTHGSPRSVDKLLKLRTHAEVVADSTRTVPFDELNSRGLDDGLKNWGLVAHSRLPIGQQASVALRWRLQVPRQLIEKMQKEPWGFSLLGFPILVVDKLTINFTESLSKKADRFSVDGYIQRGLSEEGRELGRVASMCSSMRRQLHLLHVENLVLRKTMEDMREEINERGKSNRSSMTSTIENKIKEGSFMAPDDLRSSHVSGENYQKKQSKNAGELMQPNKDIDGEPKTSETNISVSMDPKASVDVSEELKRAIMNANNSG